MQHVVIIKNGWYMKRNQEKKEVSLPLDSRNRICLSPFLTKEAGVTSYRAHREGEKIILEPMTEVPTREAWLYQNPEAISSLLEGIKQADEGNIKPLNLDLSQFDEEDDGV